MTGDAKMKKLFLLLIVLVIFAGCYTTGLSPRESGSYNYSNFVYSLYDSVQFRPFDEPQKIMLPMKLGIAQVGESSPSQLMVDILKDESGLFDKVSVIPSGLGKDSNNRKEKFKTAKVELSQMRRLANDLGVDYIFLFGGSADIGRTGNWLEVFDLTGVGAMILPSQKIRIEGQSSGALIDIKSGKVLMSVSTESSLKAMASTYNAEDTKQDKLAKLRDSLVKSLADNFVEQLASKDDGQSVE